MRLTDLPKKRSQSWEEQRIETKSQFSDFQPVISPTAPGCPLWFLLDDLNSTREAGRLSLSFVLKTVEKVGS